jgi:hypothetical protein
LTITKTDYDFICDVIRNFHGGDIERILTQVKPVTNGYQFTANDHDLYHLMEIIGIEVMGFQKVDDERDTDHLPRPPETTADKLLKIYRVFERYLG